MQERGGRNTSREHALYVAFDSRPVEPRASRRHRPTAARAPRRREGHAGAARSGGLRARHRDRARPAGRRVGCRGARGEGDGHRPGGRRGELGTRRARHIVRAAILERRGGARASFVGERRRGGWGRSTSSSRTPRRSRERRGRRDAGGLRRGDTGIVDTALNPILTVMAYLKQRRHGRSRHRVRSARAGRRPAARAKLRGEVRRARSRGDARAALAGCAARAASPWSGLRALGLPRARGVQGGRTGRVRVVRRARAGPWSLSTRDRAARRIAAASGGRSSSRARPRRAVSPLIRALGPSALGTSDAGAGDAVLGAARGGDVNERREGGDNRADVGFSSGAAPAKARRARAQSPATRTAGGCGPRRAAARRERSSSAFAFAHSPFEIILKLAMSGWIGADRHGISEGFMTRYDAGDRPRLSLPETAIPERVGELARSAASPTSARSSRREHGREIEDSRSRTVARGCAAPPSAAHLFDAGGKRVRPSRSSSPPRASGRSTHGARELGGGRRARAHGDAAPRRRHRRRRSAPRSADVASRLGQRRERARGRYPPRRGARALGSARRRPRCWQELVATLGRLVDGEVVQLRGRSRCRSTSRRTSRSCAARPRRSSSGPLRAGAREGGAPRGRGGRARAHSAATSASRSSSSTTCSTTTATPARTGKSLLADLDGGQGHAPAHPRRRARRSADARARSSRASLAARRRRTRRSPRRRAFARRAPATRVRELAREETSRALAELRDRAPSAPPASSLARRRARARGARRA